jgi:hypothetical protein
MPHTEKKEPGRSNVEQPERGDPRQHEQPIDKVRDTGNVGSRQDSRPEPGRRDDDSPWMGGG